MARRVIARHVHGVTTTTTENNGWYLEVGLELQLLLLVVEDAALGGVLYGA